MPLIASQSRRLLLVLCGLSAGVSLTALGYGQDGTATGADSGVLRGHLAPVLMGAFTPDGEYAITVSSDESARLWNLQTGREIRQYAGHTGPLYCLALSGDGRTLVTGAQDNTLRLWDVPQPRPVLLLTGHQGAAGGLAVSPDGRSLVSGAADSVVRLWSFHEVAKSVAAKKPQFAAGNDFLLRAGHRAAVTAAAWRNDSAYFASGDADGHVQVWSPFLDAVQGEIGVHAGGVTGLAFPSNNQQLISTGGDGVVRFWQLPIPSQRSLAGVTAAVTDVAIPTNQPTAIVSAVDGTLRLFDLNSGAVSREFPKSERPVTSVAVQPNNALVAAADDLGRVRLLNFNDGTERGSVAGHDKAVTRVAFHPDNLRFASAGVDGTVRLWTTPTAAVPTNGHTAPLRALASNQNGQWFVTGSDDKTVRVWASNGQPQQQQQMGGHQQPVLAVTVRRDDAQIASADVEGTILLWNAVNGATEGSLLAHSGPVAALAYEHSNQTLLSGSGDGTLKRWQLPLVPPRVSNGHSQPVQTVALSSDASVFVSGSADQTVRVWTAANGQAVRTLDGQTGAVHSVAISADGTQAAAVGAAGQVLVWTLADGALKQKRVGLAGEIYDVAFLPDGKRLATVDADQALRLWRLPEPPKELANDGAPYQVAAVSPDGKRYAVAGQSGGKHAVIVRDRDSGQVIATLTGHDAAITAIAFDRSGNRVISGSADKTSRVWKLDGGAAELFKHEGYPGAVVGVALSDDAGVAFTTGTENVIRQWSVADGAEVRSIAGHGAVVRELIVRGANLFSASDDGTVRLWNTANGAAVRAVTHGGNLRCIALSADGTKLVSGGTDKTAKLWTVANGAPIATLAGAATEVTSVVFSTDGSRVAVGASDGVRVWESDGRAGEHLQTPATCPQGVVWSADGAALLACRTDGRIEQHGLAVTQVIPLPDAGTTRISVAPDGSALFVGGAAKVVRVWSLADGRVANPAPVRTLSGPAGTITGLAVSRDGKRLAAGSEDRNAFIWDLTNGAPAAIQKLEHKSAVRSVSLSNDAARLATASDDGVTQLWDLVTGQLAERLPGPAQPARTVAISADGKTVLSGGQDNSLRTFTPAVSGVFPASAPNAAAEPVTQLVALAGDAGFAALTKSGNQVLRWKADGTVLPPLAAPAPGLVSLQASDDGLRLLATTPQPPGQGFVWTVANGKLTATLALGGAVSDAAFNRDGSAVAVTDQQARVRVFAVEPFRLLEEIAVPTTAHQVAWTGADGRQVATAGPQNSGVVVARSLERLWDGLEGSATAIVFSTSGAQAFAAGKHGRIRQWRTTDGVLERTLEGHAQDVTELAVTPNGQQLVSVGIDQTLRIWNLADGTPAGTIEHPVPVRSVSVRADSLRAATVADDGQVRVWDLATGVLLQSFVSHAKAGAAVRWLSDGITLVSGATDNSLGVAKTSIIRALRAHERAVSDMTMYAGGAQVVTCSPDGQVVMTDLNGGTVVRKFEGLTGEPRCVAARFDNQRVSVGTADGKVLVWNAGNAELLQTIEIGSPVTRLAYSPDNQKLAVVDEKNTLRIFGPVIPPEQPLAGIELYLHQEVVSAQPLTRIEFSRDNRSVWATQQDGQVGEWAYASPVQLRQFNHGGPVYAVAISRDGKTVVSGSTDQTVRIWDATTGQQRFQLNGHVGAVHAVALTPDESLIVSSGADKTIRLWDVAGGRQLKQLATLDETMYSVAVHPNGQTVAAAGADRKVHLFDLLTGTEQRTLEGHTDYIHCVAFNPQGTRLLSYGYAGQLRVWNPANGQSLFDQRVGSIGNFANYAADGTRTLLSNGDGTARVFEIPAAAR